MADNDIEIEGLIDSIRGHDPSQEEQLEPAKFISVEEVMAGPSMVSPSPLLFGYVGQSSQGPEEAPMLVSGLIPNWVDGQSNNNITIQAADGPSVTISPNGVITMSNGGSHINSFSFDMRQQAQYVEDLRQRVHTLENLVNLLGTALNAQIDNDTMAGLAPHERQEIRRVVAERNANQQRRDELRQLMRQQSLYPTMRALK